VASYAYDWREQRVASSSQAGGDRHYLFGDAGELFAEYDAASGALVREFVWLDATPLAMINGPLANPTYTWITTGHLDEPLLLTDAAGAVVSSVTRDPWGNRVLLAGGDPLDLGYPGQWRDGASGLLQNHHRDYDPMTGRYIEADPLGLGGGSNLYAYVGGDPINAVDPDGRRSATTAEVGKFAFDWWLKRQARPSRKTPWGRAISIGDALGAVAAVAKYCYDHADGDDPDEDGPCEFQKREDELDCNQWNITGAREGLTRKQGYAACLRTVMIRYSECLSRGRNPNRISTPLFLPTGRRGGPDRSRTRS
jgi:RHS repeat-associated protein